MEAREVTPPEDAGISRRTAISTLLAFAFRADPARAWGYLGLTLVASVIVAGQALPFKLIFDAVLAGDRASAFIWVGVLVATVAFVQLSVYPTLAMRIRLGETLQIVLDDELMRLTTELPGLEHHERPEFADQLSRIRQQRGQMVGALGILVTAISLFVTALTSAGLLLSVHPLLMLFPLSGYASMKLEAVSERVRQRARDATSERGRVSWHLYELASTAAPAKELRVFGTAPEIARRHLRLTQELRAELNRERRKASALSAAGWAVFAAAFAAALFFVIGRVLAGAATPGDILLFLTLGSRINGLVSGLASQVRQTTQSMDLVKRYIWFRDYAARSGHEPGTRPAPAQFVRGITLEEVGFTYPGTDRTVLEGVNLHLPAGATVALVGDNGAGKTTLVKMLCGFYPPTTGQIAVDGIDLSEFDPADFRRAMAAGFQDFVKFEFLARETVGIGELSLFEDEDAVERALSRAGGSDVIADLPHGLHTQLGRSFEGGVELSGGQWQKLALGRAMMREAPLLLVLDEPTAALDAETEHALFERYSAAAQRAQSANGGITLLVSHRFSTVRMADLIAVVADGTVLEVGSHEDLMAKNGRYAELYNLQAKAYS